MASVSSSETTVPLLPSESIYITIPFTCLLYTSILLVDTRNGRNMGRILMFGKFEVVENSPCRRNAAAEPVSYTHLDVYKRQIHYREFQKKYGLLSGTMTETDYFSDIFITFVEGRI